MIFPILHGLLNFYRVPMTWMLVLINAFVFVSVDVDVGEEAYYEKLLGNDYFLQAQGEFYSQYIERDPSSFSPVILELSQLTQKGDKDQGILLGSLALRNSNFVNDAPKFEFKGDQVKKSWWLSELKKLRAVQESHPSYILGLNANNTEFGRWITYQFAHSGAMHFLSNMLFLIIFGGALELVIGGLGLLLVYLGTGVAAAGAFLIISGASSIPLIGASGSISGIMALFCFMRWNEKVNYFYFLFIPKPEYWGLIKLPAWITLIMWMASDTAGYLSTVSELGGIAYTAHLGGQLSGIAVGLLFFMVQKIKPSSPAQSLGA